MKLTKGQIVALTEGEYSDYGIKDHLRVASDFDIAAAREEFKGTDKYLERPDWEDPKAECDESLWSYGSPDRFIAWLIQRGQLEPLKPDEVVTYHIGRYGHL